MLTLLLLLAGPRLPAQSGGTWTDTDIGAVGLAGSSTQTPNEITLRGAGADIWGQADGFHFLSQTLTGDGALRARVITTGTGHAWAKVGLMIREDLTPGSRNLMVLLTPGGSLGVQVRATAGGPTTYAEQARTNAPLWLMLHRQGNNFTAYRSFDGEQWTPAGSTISLALPSTVHIGLAVTSHQTGALQTATFHSVIRTSGVEQEALVAPANLQVHSPFGGALQLDWADRSSTETGFKIERAPEGGSFSTVAVLNSDTVAFVDHPLTPGTRFSYRVSAIRNSLVSAHAGPVSGQVGAVPLASAWTGSDIGNTGSTGSDSGMPPTFTMNAGGSDIYGTADSFRYRFMSLAGDGAIVARVTSQTNTHAWAKAGVMFRTSLQPGAANVAMLLTPGNGATFQARRFANATTSHGETRGITAPYWVKLTRSGNAFNGYVSADGTNWTFAGAQLLEMPGQAYVGFAASAHASAQTIVSFDQAAVEGPPGTMVQRNLGTGTGTVTTESNITIQTTSGDIYGTADSGVLYSRLWSASFGVFTTRIEQLTPTHDWAKAGIMFRAGPAADAANVFVAITPTQGAVLQSRSTAGGATVTHARAWGVGPGKWLRIFREGGTISAYWSPDASTWTLIGSLPDPLPETIHVGLAASSHNPAAATTAVFSGLGDI